MIEIANERVTPAGWKALAGSAIGYAMDGFDLLILGFILSPISADLGLTNAQAGSLVTCTLIGAVAGGILFGTLSDHFGRIRVLTWTILLFAVFTGLCGLARGYWDLVVYRMAAGLGLGGEFGIGMALASEAWPASMRASFLLRRPRLAGGRSTRRHRNSHSASSDRLARHVRRRPAAGAGRLRRPPLARRTGDLRS